MTLIDRIKKARQTIVKVGEITLICRRPTDLEMLEMRQDKISQGDILKRFVDGWEGVTEVDLVPGGTSVAAPFSRELFAEWVSDHPESWAAITEAVVSEYKKHESELESAAKN
jgi:hypothetical protein